MRHQHSDAECKDTDFSEIRLQGGKQALEPQCPSHCRSRAKHLGLASLVTLAISSGHTLSWLIKQSLWERQTELCWSLSCAQAGDKPELFSTSEHMQQPPHQPPGEAQEGLRRRWTFSSQIQGGNSHKGSETSNFTTVSVPS